MKPSGPCEAFGLEAEVDFATNGCRYVLHAGTSSGEGASTGTVDLVCADEEGALLTVAGGGLCDVRMPPQEGLGPIHYETVAGEPSAIAVEVQLANIEYVEEGVLCANPGETLHNGEAFAKDGLTATTNDQAEEPLELSVVEGEGGAALFGAG